MSAKMNPEFEGLCVGMDVWLTDEGKHPNARDTPQSQFEWAVKKALSSYDKPNLMALDRFLGEILTSADAGRTLEELWMSLKPTRVFFSAANDESPEPPYVTVFKQVHTIIRELLAD
jgi:hypothetical protein